MLNNAALEVVIGLIFIYTLYSLLATTLTELIATVFNQRAINLKQGIRRMLDDDNGAILSDDFYNRPEVKFLGRRAKGNSRLPSYIKPSTFASALVRTLMDAEGVEANLKELTKRLKPKSGEHQSETKAYLYNLMLEADGSMERFKELLEGWFDETMERVAGWYKKRVQIITIAIGVLLAFSLNVNTIQIAKELSAQTNARVELVKAATTYAATVESTDLLATSNLNKRVESIIDELEGAGSVISMSWPSREDFLRGSFLLSYIIGCLITAIAISLGSPFWFDLLNKVVKFKGVGSNRGDDSKKEG